MSISSESQNTSHPISVAIPPTVPAEIYAEVAHLGLGDHFPAVLKLTEELLGPNFEISIERDPEIFNWSHVVFTASVKGTMEEILDLQTQWVRRLPHDTTEACGAFCVSIEPLP